jgi:hypothetical protein
MLGRGADVVTSWPMSGWRSQMDCSRLRISSAFRVSSNRGRGRGRPDVFVRIRFVEDRWKGRVGTAGEPLGLADMRSSSPLLPSSSAFLLRLDMLCEGERAVRRCTIS